LSKLSDTHCHLYLEEFADDLPEVLERAKVANVRKILVPGIDAQTSQQALALSQAYKGWLYAAVGIHPNYANEAGKSQIDAVEALLKANTGNIKAVGEIGLDYYRTWASHEDQVFVFQNMLDLAALYHLPVCLHIREAEEEILKILGEWMAELNKRDNPLAQNPGVFHSYSGSAEVAEFAIQHHFMLGISGPVTFKNDHGLRERIAAIGIDHLIIETDAPYLAPHPRRGHRNEPALVAFVLASVAAALGLEAEQAAQITSQNAQRLFNWNGN
jgi:TatD DNase family protein